MLEAVNFLIADEMFEEKTEEPEPDKKDKQYVYIDEEGDGASSSRIIGEDDVSSLIEVDLL